MNKYNTIKPTREQRDIEAVSKDNSNYSAFADLPDKRKTEAVSLSAVSAYGNNLEFVPDDIKTKEICRTALQSKDIDCDILMHIPFPDVSLEGVHLFAEKIEPFVLFSFVDITNEKIAKEAINADGYCLQLVPEKILTEDMCKTAILNSDIGVKILDFIPDKLFTPAVCETAVKKFENGIEWLPKEKRTAELAKLAKNEHPTIEKQTPKNKQKGIGWNG